MLLSGYVKKYAENVNRVAVNFYGRKVTYKELDESSDRLATALADLGYKKGDHIAFFLQNGPQAYIGYLAAEKLGLVRTPVDPMHKERELAYQLKDSETTLIMVQDQIYPVVKNVRDECKIEHVIVTSFHDYLPDKPEIPLHPMMKAEKQTFADTYEFLDLIKQYEPSPPKVDVELSDFGWLLYTGGTTGLPKGCIHTNYNAVASAVGGGYIYGGIINPFTDIEVGAKIIAAFPVTHISGIITFCACLVWGMQAIMLARMDPLQILEAVDRYKATILIAPALIFNTIVQFYPELSKTKKYDLSSLKLCACTSHGGPWTKELAKRWYDLTGLYLYSWGYSGTEFFDYPAGGICLNRLEEMAYGKPGPGFRVRIKDPHTHEDVPVGERGEIVAKAVTLFKGYWKNPKKTEETLVNGWFHTGDIGALGEDGTLYFYGRATYAFPVSGYQVSPDEVEAIGLTHPDIVEISVIPIPNPDRPGDNVPKAFVVLRPGSKVTEAELLQWFKDNIARYKCPREIEIGESLPKSVKGEILRRELIKRERERRERH